MSLSDKQEDGSCPACDCRHRDEYYWFKHQDVKEAVKKLKEDVMDLSILQKNAHLNFKAEFVTILEDKIDKIFGEDLI